MSIEERLQRMLEKGTARFQEQILQAGGSLNLTEVADRLGLSPSDVLRMIDDRKILAQPYKADWLFPKKQFVGDRVISGLDVVYQALDESCSQAEAVLFFLTPARGKISPLEHLLNGTSPDAVAIIAKGHLVQGCD